MQAQDAQALQQSSANQLAELQWELQHAWQQSDQADKAQKAALQAAQDRIAMLEADCRRSSNNAARVEEKAARAEADGVRFSQELTDVKVCICFSKQAVKGYNDGSAYYGCFVTHQCLHPHGIP